MILRFVAAISVMVGCGGLGLYYAAREGFRINELQELKKSLLILSSEIEYMRAPLNVACSSIAKRTEGAVSTLFRIFAETISKNNGETAYQAWVSSLSAIKEKSFLAEEDIGMLDGFGKTLGYLDKQMQQSAIDYTINYIDEKVTTLHAQNNKNKRMYRSLGVIAGLLITVVLW